MDMHLEVAQTTKTLYATETVDGLIKPGTVTLAIMPQGWLVQM